ncbi:ATP synthase F0 subunit C [Planctomicrobium piriforme]|uniref:ATP synthase subunit c n=1 Tax=Planctomicrobium piriforme TaxID=1576369 RepID=A0A1I3S7R3_9PLAN|nr:ATP synthase F0 subunit C [Planctomicrobium piriforme]SFJ53581.1 F-type H+-transporting ATPase subunit c [Planctomicrobium piriforme]
MNRILQLCFTMAATVLVFATPAFAQQTVTTLIELTPPFGAGLIIIGAGLGIGKIGAAAMEGISRQPEAAGDIRGGMILAAALIEGVALLALIVCFIQ